MAYNFKPVSIKGSSIVYPYKIPLLYKNGGEPDFTPTSKYYNKVKGIPHPSERLASTPKLSGKINNISNKAMGTGNDSIRYNKLSSIVPYASNVINGFRKLPSPIPSNMESSVSPNLVNYDASRNAIDVDQRNLNRETDYRVSNPAVAQAIKATTFGKSILGKNQLAQEETNTNAQIKNQNNQFNQGVQVRNIERQNQFNNNLVGRNITQQNLMSDNLANIGDKYQEQTRDKSLMELENRRLGYLSDFYEKNDQGSSVWDRERKNNPNVDKEGYFKGELGGDIDPNKLLKERTQKRDSVRNLLNNKFPHNYKKVNDKMLDYFQTEPEEYKNIKVYATGGEVDPNKPAKPTAKDFTLQPWSKQGVMDSTGRAPMYKTTYSALNRLDGQVIPKGLDPNSEVYSQIDNLDRKLNPVLNGAKPVSSFGSDIYGDQTLNNQGRNIKRFASGGGIHIKPSHKGRFTAYKARTGQTTAQALHSSNPHVRQMANFTRNAAKWHH